MRFVLMTEPQLGGTYDDLLFAARTATRAGLEGFSRSDHYYSGKPGLPTTDAFATMGGLARETDQIRLGVLVSPITFRHPAVIAKTAASLDEMSGGRFDLGLGAGWMEAEHAAFGLPLPPLKERFERLDESLQYLHAVFEGGGFAGRYYRTHADARPRPAGLRIIVGGSGPKKTPALAGRFADEYNQSVAPPAELAARVERMREAATAAGRDASAIVISVMGPAILADTDQRLRELMGRAAASRGNTVAELEERWTRAWVPRGTSERAAEMFAAFESVGVSKYYLQWFDLTDRDGIAEQAELAGRLAG